MTCFGVLFLQNPQIFFYITSGKKRGLLLGNFCAVIIFVTESFREAQEVRSAGKKTTKINIKT